MATKWRWLISAATILLSMFGMGGIAAAATTPQVSGTITHDGVAAANTSVSVVCTAAGGSHTRSATTSSTGHYSVSFAAGQCDDGSQIAVTATSSDGASSGQASGVMGAGGTTQHATIDCQLAAAVPLPEFAPITFVLALAAVVGTLAFVRHWRFGNESPKT